jgi:hypothetical protein
MNQNNKNKIMTKIINMTPHPITIVDKDGNITQTIESSGSIRLKAETMIFSKINGIPITKTVFGEPEGLPPYEFDTYYIVSQLVKTALPKRHDLLVPAELVRDEKGNIKGCKSLGQ